jgi:hypothetical protein
LFTAGKFLDVVRGEGEEVCDAWGDLVEEGLLSFAERWFRKEFEVLRQLISDLFPKKALSKTYSCCLEDFGHSGEITDAGVED